MSEQGLEKGDERLKRIYAEAMKKSFMPGFGDPFAVDVTEVNGVVEVGQWYVLWSKTEDVEAEVVKP